MKYIKVNSCFTCPYCKMDERNPYFVCIWKGIPIDQNKQFQDYCKLPDMEEFIC